MIAIGVAGGIASGKTAVCQVFEDLGGVIINADIIGHETLENPYVRDQLTETFGHEIINEDGVVDRSVLGRIVFSDPAARHRLNTIVHPPLLEEIRRRIDEQRTSGSGGAVVVDAALLIEWGRTDLVDVVIVVTAPDSIRIARLIERNNLSSKEAVQRLTAQITDEERNSRANYVIDNRGSLAELKREAELIWRQIVKDGDRW